MIDANSAAAIAAETGELWDGIGGGGKARREKTGSPVIMPDKAATGAVFAPMDMVVKRWIGEADAAGLDRAALVEAVRAAVTARLD